MERTDLKKIKDMTQEEFNQYKIQCLNKPFSRFAKFSTNLRFLRLERNGKEVCKWEAFFEGHNAEDILAGKTDIKVFNKNNIECEIKHLENRLSELKTKLKQQS